MSEQSEATFLLKHWRFFEKHFHEFHEFSHFHFQAIVLFKELKKLHPEEVLLLSERYYKSTEPTSYSERDHDYLTYKPVSFDILVSRLGKEANTIRKELKAIEKRLGANMRIATEQLQEANKRKVKELISQKC